MADINPPVNTGAPQVPPRITQDEEAIAERDRMEMSAPIEQAASSDQKHAMALSADVAPFVDPAGQPPPEVDYVPTDPKDFVSTFRTVAIPQPVQRTPSASQKVDEEVLSAPEVSGPIAPVTPIAPKRIITAPGPIDHVVLSDGPAMKYSHNSHAVWKSNRSSKMLHVMAWGGLLIFFAAILVYWLLIGSPTRAEDIPLVKSLVS